jgi:hypothetical protein
MVTIQTGPSPDHILETGLGFWASKTLLSAVEMGVFTELADGPQEFNKLSGRLGLHERSARDFLDALVALGFLKRMGTTYSNTEETDLFLDKRKPSYLGGILEMANARLFGRRCRGLAMGRTWRFRSSFRGRSTRRSPMWARRRETWRRRLPWRILI